MSPSVYEMLRQYLKDYRGFTFDVEKQQICHEGVCCGINGFQASYSPARFNAASIQEYVSLHPNKLNSGLKLGGWMSPEGQPILDLVELHDTLQDALVAGKRHNQYSVYDLNTGIEYVVETGKAVEK